ncbi:hypothetical protein [Hymenobacter armeniacus]|uniref:Uncharacterized protein n=1 Tax=Hymenobacter armeniacus TaxID=2771358 RepID=A0ABR8JP16_9BACT|nr:hypothetical protein [Hymenobacter armeniacus]MBD2721746.1 hypothetical protein [Hymenobacter armeniacus]
MKLIERLLSVLAWLQIFISPALIGIIVGAAIWLIIKGTWGIILAAVTVAAGVIAGIAFAEKARRAKGTIEFMSRLIAHPELREKEITNDSDRIK